MIQCLRRCAQLPVQRLLPAHFEAPVVCESAQLIALADAWERQVEPEAEQQDRSFLRSFNRQIERLGLVPRP
mgnify:FL=1